MDVIDGKLQCTPEQAVLLASYSVQGKLQNIPFIMYVLRTVVRWPSGLEHWLGLATGWSRPSLNPTAATYFRFGTLAILFTPLCQCLPEEKRKAVGPFWCVCQGK